MQINSVGTTSFRSRTNDHKYGYIGYNVTPYNLIGVKPKNNDKTTCDETIFKKTPKQKVPRRSNLDGCHWHMHGSNDLENWRAGSN